MTDTCFYLPVDLTEEEKWCKQFLFININNTTVIHFKGCRMSCETTSNYEIKISKTDHRIPVINGVHLHSIYNPIKEAENLMVKHEAEIAKKNKILVLGIGFGYHINEVLLICKRFHGSNFTIYIVEPRADIAEDCLRYAIFDQTNIKIFAGNEVQDLYSNKELVNFLVQKPLIIPHPASFNLYANYFKDFLSYRADNSVEKIIQNIQNKELVSYCKNIDQTITINDYITNQLSQKSRFSSELDFLIMAFDKMCSGQVHSKELM